MELKFFNKLVELYVRIHGQEQLNYLNLNTIKLSTDKIFLKIDNEIKHLKSLKDDNYDGSYTYEDLTHDIKLFNK